MFFREVAHEKLLGLQSARIPPRQTNQKRVRAGPAGKARSFRIEEKPFFRILERGACFTRNRFVARA